VTRSELLDGVARDLAARTSELGLRVGVNGVDAAGKTTFADELAECMTALGCPVVRASVDDFARPRNERYARGRYSPEGYYRDTTDLEALSARLLQPLGPGGSRRYVTRVFDVWDDRPVEEPERTAPEGAVLLLDGIFLLRSELRGLLDYAIFLDVDFGTCLERALVRDSGRVGVDEAETRAIYARRYFPAQSLYFDNARPLERADLVIDNRDLAAPRVTRERAGRRGGSGSPAQ